MNEHAIDEQVKHLLDVATEDPVSEQRLLRTLERSPFVDAESPRDRSRRSKRPRKLRVAVAVFAAIALVTSVAVAQPSIRQLFGDSPDDAADQVSSFQQPESRTSPGVSVFTDPNSADEEVELPSVARSALTAGLVGDESLGDTLDDTYLRSLVRVGGPERTSGLELIAVPTTSGGVCTVVFHRLDVIGLCFQSLTREHPVTHAFGMTGGELRVFGVSRDDVERVDVMMDDGEPSPATMGQNGYAWVGPAAGKKPLAVRAQLADGTTVTEQLFRDGFTADRIE